jgi:uncharacterized membrane protein YkoI
MKRNSKVVAVLGGAAATIALTAGVGVASGVGGDDSSNVPITGEALTKASALALQQTGDGRVTATEQGGDESYYQVEVTRADGSQVDVQLDKDFNVLSAKADDGA